MRQVEIFFPAEAFHRTLIMSRVRFVMSADGLRSQLAWLHGNVPQDPGHQARPRRPEHSTNPVCQDQLFPCGSREGFFQLRMQRHLNQKRGQPQKDGQTTADQKQTAQIARRRSPAQPERSEQLASHQWQDHGADSSTMSRFVRDKVIFGDERHQRIIHCLNQPNESSHRERGKQAGQKDH